MGRWLQEPEVRLTENCWRLLEKYNISKDKLLQTFNSPQKETRMQSGVYQYVYKYERNFEDYGIGLRCFWASDNQRWVITSCWKYKR